MQEKFSYSSEPHAAPLIKKSKYRENILEPSSPSSHNLMNDPRVIRGNTYSSSKPNTTTTLATPTNIGENILPLPPQQQYDNSKKQLKKLTYSSNSSSYLNNKIPGNKKRNNSTKQEIILKELVDRPIEIDIDVQAQLVINRPISPLFIASKNGRDIGTQIEAGDLFDFDIEVEPILEVLVSKTIHVSMLELEQEEEFETIRRAQEQFELIRNIELSELQRLQSEVRRRQNEKERRLQQEKKRQEERNELESKITAREFSRNYLSTLHTDVIDELESEGCFYDPIKKEIEENIIHLIVNGMKNNFQKYSVACELVEELMLVAWDKASEMQEKCDKLREIQREKERKEAELLAKKKVEEEAARKLAEEAARKAAEENQEDS